VYAFLSEKTEEIISGKIIPFNITQFSKDIIRGVLLALRNMAVEIGLTLLLFVLSFIPIVGYLTPIALFLVSAYFYGFSFMDYTFERKRFKIDYSVRFMRRNKGLAIGNGFVFSLVLLIPYIGVMIAGFVSIVSVVAATLAAGEVIDSDS
ncbi:MAG: EI24 domain-containing protein, partial [Carboxylicivirga sp.]|nr:EI24 domain-containing protein [Carboxylicivirga sp.]